MKFNIASGVCALLPGTLFLWSLGAQAQTITPKLETTVGSGSNLSYFVLDFQDGTPDHSYAFGYRYDGVKTGADLLAALTNNPLTVDATTYPFGVFVSGFGYNGHVRNATGNAYWAYFLSSDGVAWDGSGVGASDRVLTNGSYDGWSFDADYTNAAALIAPVTPQAVPEPGSITIVAALCLPLVGRSFLSRRRARIATSQN